VVIATSSSDEKLDIAKSLGATHVINYKKDPEWAGEVRRLTNGQGADLVIDVGGSATIEQAMKATGRGGVIVCVGFFGKPEPKIMVENLIFGGLTGKMSGMESGFG
jgi:NADPH:quinone reductase-like Zn-dependent oxidoreductase